MTRDEFVNHVLAACGCEFRDGKEWFEKEELIKCADDLYFKNPEYQSENCISRADVEKEFERWHKNRTTVYTFHRRVMELPSVQPINNSVIEDIKKEIKDLHNSHMINFVSADGAVDTCLEIIEKHIADMRGTE